MEPIVIMHISDPHFGMPEDMYNNHPIPNRDTVFESFISSFKTDIPDIWKPDILVVSGDIGWSGSKPDYNTAKKFFNNFLKIDDQKIKSDSIVLCPGNHDTFHDEAQNIFWKRQRLEKDKPLADEANKGVPPIRRQTVSVLRQHFQNFEAFCKSMNFAALNNNSKCYTYTYGSCSIKGVRFVVMNTEWDFLGKNDKLECKGRLRIGADLLDDAQDCLPKKDSNALSIVVYHRPLDDWLHISEIIDGDNGSAKEKILHHDFSLVGHYHRNELGVGRYTHKTFVAGTLYSNESSAELCCNLIRLYPNNELQDKQKYFCNHAYFKYAPPLPNFRGASWSWSFSLSETDPVPIYRFEKKEAEEVQKFISLLDKYMAFTNRNLQAIGSGIDAIGLTIKKLWNAFDEEIKDYFLSIEVMQETLETISKEMAERQRKADIARSSAGQFKAKEYQKELVPEDYIPPDSQNHNEQTEPQNAQSEDDQSTNEAIRKNKRE